ncbi:MAG: archaetidylserine decarboxylase [Desulfobacteraceae bacterium]|jgi:phosphatidylserine decarboxylase
MAVDRPTSEAIRLYNRRTRAIECEQVPGGRFLTFFYGRPWGRLVARWVWSRVLFSRFYGWIFHRRFSRRQIDRFVTQSRIDMSEVHVPKGGFQTFNDFFIRRLKPGARPIASDPTAVISPADSRLKVIQLQNKTLLHVKGVSLTLAQLLCTDNHPDQFADGLCLQFRLAPRDYHRFGYIEDGVQSPVRVVGGRLYSVSPLALRHIPAIWAENHRHWCVIETRSMGPILQIEVGATVVGSIIQHRMDGGYCHRGEEKGYFQMGGSTVLIIIQPGRVKIDDDILNHSNQDIETLVRYGEAVGRIQ